MLDADSFSKPMFVPPSEALARPFFDRVHEWIVTVDHKKLGLMYITYGILFRVSRLVPIYRESLLRVRRYRARIRCLIQSYSSVGTAPVVTELTARTGLP